MNKMFKYIGCALASALVIFACSPDEFNGANESGLPTVSGRSIVVSTDQETNTATFYVTGDMTGCYPVWYLDGSNYSILTTASYTSLSAGTHTLQAYLLNRNGVSQAALEAEFTFENTITDYTVYFNRLCDKEWRIAYSEAGHMGCGESGSDGSNWWSAGVNEKADYGVYDDRCTYTHSDSDAASGGSYTYNPGDGGTVYVNYGCETLNTTGATEDFMMEVSSQTSGFEFVEGTYNDEDCLYLQFDPYTLLPYIPNDDTYKNPYYRIETLTNTRMALVCDNGEIAWRLVFTSREDTGLDDDDDDSTDTMNWDWSSDDNLWKPVDMGDAFVSVSQWFADDSWNQISDAEWSHTEGDDEWSLVIPEGTGGSQWQGQFAIHTSLALSGTQYYNVYLVMNMDNDSKAVTIKLTEDGNDDNYFFADQHSITSDTDYIFKAKNVTLSQGTDASAMAFFFDFGGTPAGTNVTISNIYIVESDGSDDDETATAYNWDYSADYNLWTAVDEGTAFDSVSQWFADDSWNQISDAEWSHTEGDDEWSLVIPEGTGSIQWQGQFHIKSSLSATAGTAYNIYLLMDMDNDASGVTIKMTDASNDNNYFMSDRINVTADETYIYKITNVTLSAGADASAVNLVFDFAGTPAGTVVKIHDIFFAEADSDETPNDSSSGSETVTLDYDSDGNIWKAVDEGTSFDSYSYWFADNGWSTDDVTQPECTHSGSEYTIILPSGMGGTEWQGQFHIISSLSLSGSSTYSFGCTITADDDISRMTVKVTDNTNDDNYCYYINSVSFEAGTYTIAETGLSWSAGDVSQLSVVFDFGGCNAYTEVTLSDIVLIQE